ncbi:MAG: thioredoxin [Lachnospiraceae bacterium]|jgi:thioredoxin 1|nr:thioredoxin [Lachnospiraceae bacterium]MBR2531449.1 thioredoxin [Lachnospiraceae bacterium]
MVTKIVNNDMSAAAAAPVALIDFSAVWCGPCKMVSPVIDSLSEKYAGKIEFFNADVDENMDLAAKYGIQNIPSLMLLKNGEAVDMKVGFMPEPILAKWIDSQI